MNYRDNKNSLKGPLFHPVSPRVSRSLQKMAEGHIYDSPSYLFYEGQIPIVAFLLVKGRIQLRKDRRISKVLHEGQIVGLNELINDEPSHYTAYILPNTHVCFLDRSTVIEILDEENGEHDPHLIENVRPVLLEIIEYGAYLEA